MTAGANRLRGLTLAFISSISFATSGPLATAAVGAGLTAAQTATVRIGLAAVLVFLAVAAFRPRALRFTRGDLPVLLGYGLFGVAGAQLLFFLAIARIPVGIAMLLEFLAPLYVALWIRFVRRTRLARAVWLGIGLALAGLVLVAQPWQGFALDPTGVLAGFCSGLSTTGYFLIGEHAANTKDPFGVLAVGLVIGAVIVGAVAPPWNLPFGLLDRPVELGGAQFPLWPVLLAIVLFSTVLAYLGGIFSLRHLSPAAASALGLLEPTTATVLAWWLLGQALSPAQVAGGLVVLGGAALVQFATGKHVPPEAEPVC
ncbi:EamA family transporter [Sciscionella sediminilitoris]|uniref:EamA family transporter n=1 Tax=Sciscionella sediminilitoris TaxID=1445613 RepID=UPI0004DF1178|nr:EamA family transporter [Sciscionella sp. SE31]